MNQRLIITILIAFLLVGGTFCAIKFAQGYRVNLKDKKLSGTGLLVANSFPKGASVYINDKLATATDSTINLAPGDYQIKIVKEGYNPWAKKLKLQKELVAQTNAQLFPSVPDLKGLTSAGALNLTPSPDGQKMAFSVASSSAKLKNGLWLLEMASSPLSFAREPRQISQNNTSFDFGQAKLVWSPNSKQILAWSKTSAFLLEADRFNDTLKDITPTLAIVLKDWEEQLDLKRKRQMEKLPKDLQTIILEATKNLYFSPDEEKIMYTATASSTLKQGLKPALPASNTQPENRSLEPGKIYIYDLKEDKNFYITDQKENISNAPDQTKKKLTEKEKQNLASEAKLDNIQNQYSPWRIQSLQWFPTSQHLILTENNKIIILEYDNTNRSTVYAGPFEDSYVYPWPDGSRLLILTTLNPGSSLPSNLYTIDLK